MLIEPPSDLRSEEGADYRSCGNRNLPAAAASHFGAGQAADHSAGQCTDRLTLALLSASAQEGNRTDGHAFYQCVHHIHLAIVAAGLREHAWKRSNRAPGSGVQG